MTPGNRSAQAPYIVAVGLSARMVAQSARRAGLNNVAARAISDASWRQLRTMLDWEIVPKLRNVPGVVEVNTMGGDLKQFQVVVDRARLKAHGLSLSDVVNALRSANVNAGGGYIDRREESFTVRGQGMLATADEIGQVAAEHAARRAVHPFDAGGADRDDADQHRVEDGAGAPRPPQAPPGTPERLRPPPVLDGSTLRR